LSFATQDKGDGLRIIGEEVMKLKEIGLKIIGKNVMNLKKDIEKNILKK